MRLIDRAGYRWANLLQEIIKVSSYSWKFRPCFWVEAINIWCCMEFNWSYRCCFLFKSRSWRYMLSQINDLSMGIVQKKLQADTPWHNFNSSKHKHIYRAVLTVLASIQKDHLSSHVALIQEKCYYMIILMPNNN